MRRLSISTKSTPSNELIENQLDALNAAFHRLEESSRPLAATVRATQRLAARNASIFMAAQQTRQDSAKHSQF